MLSTCHHQVEFYDSFIFSVFNLQGSFYILTITNLWYFLLGKVPFVRANNFVIAELDPIIGFINTKVNKLLFKYQTLLRTMIIFRLFRNYSYFNNPLHFQGISLTEHLDAAQKADMRAYMSLVSNVLGNAEVRLVQKMINALIFNLTINLNY